MEDDELMENSEQDTQPDTQADETTEQGTQTEQTTEDTPTDIEDVLIGLLESLNYPVYRQGSFSEDDQYPESFFTFWNNDSADHSHYDNDNYGTDWNFSVNFYSEDPTLTYSVIADTRILLKQNDWIVPSKGYDINSDADSHTGRGLTVFYLET